MKEEGKKLKKEMKGRWMKARREGQGEKSMDKVERSGHVISKG